jgi:hypothetical protein
MNRYLTQFFYSFFKKACLISGKIPLSAAAAVGTVSIKGIASVTKTDTGEYTIVLSDSHYAIVGIGASAVGSTEDLAVAFASIDLATKTAILETRVAGVLADVTDACDLYVSFLFNDTSVQ